MKRIHLVLLALLVAVSTTAFCQQKAAAQTNTKNVVFKYNQHTLKRAVKSKHLVFYTSGLKDAQQAKAFVNKAKYYTKYFTMKATDKFVSGSREIDVDFVQNNSMKILKRFFVANSIQNVMLGDQKMSLDQFFGSYMK